MRFIIYLAFAVAPHAVEADCPAVGDRTARHSELMELVATAPNETQARAWTDELWSIWATAPDDTAQEILIRGMERRAAYDFAGAIRDFTSLIEYCPGYAEGYNQRAFIHFIVQDYEASLIDLERALERLPDHIGALTGKALTLLQLGRVREGQIVLRQAVALHPWLPERNRLQPLDDLDPPEQEL